MNKKESKKRIKLANMCKAAWTMKKSRKYIKEELIQGNTFNFPNTDVEGFWGEDLEGCYIIFRSTELYNLEEWSDNFDLHKRRIGKIKYHRGVADKLDIEVVDFIKRLLKELNKANKPIYITGHSLGGVLARLVGYYATIDNIKYDHIYTFGSYASGNRKFHKLMRDKITNVFARHDFAVCFNWFLHLLGYRAKHEYIEDNGKWYHWNYHFINVYIDSLENNLDK